MSRIGKLPVSLPTGVSVELLDGNVLKVKGPHGEMCQKIDPDIKVTVEDPSISPAAMWIPAPAQITVSQA